MEEKIDEVIKKLKDIKDDMPSGGTILMIFLLLVTNCDTNRKLGELIEIQSKK